MQNFDEMMKKQQQDYQRSRNPFEYGQQVAQRRYSEIMANIDAQKAATQESYGDLYQRARQSAIGMQAAGGPRLTGGMGQQRRDFISAAEMQQLGQIGSGRERAMREIGLQGQSAFSNAQLEGQQATQMQLANQQAQFQLYQQRQAILQDSNLTPEEKQTQLEMLGQPMTPDELASTTQSSAAGTAFGAAAAIGIPAGTMAIAKGAAQVAALNQWTTVGLPAAKKAAYAAAKAAVKNMPLGAAGRRQAMNLAYKAAMAKAKAPTLGLTGKLYTKILGKGVLAKAGAAAPTKMAIAKGVAKGVFKFAGKAIGIYAIVSGVETLAELLGVAGGRGFSGFISKEGTTWDKILEGIGL